MLNHCITKPYTERKRHTDPFITRYVFPDGELEPVGMLVTEMNDAGFEIRHEENLREHYALTLRDWGANLERHWDSAVAEVGDRAGPGVAAVHGGVPSRVRDGQHPAAPGARREAGGPRPVGVPVARRVRGILKGVGQARSADRAAATAWPA